MSETARTIAELQRQMDEVPRTGATTHSSSAPGSKPQPVETDSDKRKPAEADLDEREQGDSGLGESGLGESEQRRAVRSAALRLLNGRSRTRQELRVKLLDKDHDEGDIAAILDRFEEVSLLDDAEYARMWVRTRSDSKNLAAGRLRRELQEKGVAPEIIDESLSELSVEGEQEAARRLLEQKIKNVDLPPAGDRSAEAFAQRQKVIRRLVGVLARRGHSGESVMRLIDEVLEAKALD